MMTKFLGDLHAERRQVHRFKENVIQIGDLDLLGYDWWGYQFSTDEEWKDFYGDAEFPTTMRRFNSPPIETGRRYFIDGNHDYFPALNPDAEEPYFLRPGLVYIPRGYVSGKTMFIGGAESIDRAFRTPYLDWFPEERFNSRQESRILGYEGEIEVIVSHDVSISAAAEILRGRGKPVGFHSSHFLEAVWKKFRPALWVCGHFHLDRDFILEGEGFSTRFVCCNIAQTKEFDIPLAPDFFTKEWKKGYGRDNERWSS